MATWQLPAELSRWSESLAGVLDARIAWRLRPMLVGLFFARGRRTITSWLRAIGVRRHHEDYYYFLGSLGRKCESLAGLLVRLILQQLPLGDRVLFALDDTPTKRYGPQVEGAGIHHNPTPGPAGGNFFYGHNWVTLAAVVRHARFGTIGLPLLARLYVRAANLRPLRVLYHWKFRTKLELAAELVEWLAKWLNFLGKSHLGWRGHYDLMRIGRVERPAARVSNPNAHLPTRGIAHQRYDAVVLTPIQRVATDFVEFHASRLNAYVVFGKRPVISVQSVLM